MKSDSGNASRMLQPKHCIALQGSLSAKDRHFELALERETAVAVSSIRHFRLYAVAVDRNHHLNGWFAFPRNKGASWWMSRKQPRFKNVSLLLCVDICQKKQTHSFSLMRTYSIHLFLFFLSNQFNSQLLKLGKSNNSSQPRWHGWFSSRIDVQMSKFNCSVKILLSEK